MQALTKKSRKGDAQRRRTKALAMLEMQLQSGLKTEKVTGNHIPLTDKDREKKQQEIAILRERLK